MKTIDTTEVTESRLFLEAYAIRLSGYYFNHLDEDGYPVLFKRPSAFSREGAEKLVKELADNPNVWGSPTIVKIPRDKSDDIGFWVDEGNGRLSSCHLDVAQPLRSIWEVPDWFKASVMASDPTNPDWDDHTRDDSNIAWYIFADNLRGWFKHGGWSGKGEDSYLVSEPYDLGPDAIHNLVKVCEKFNFDFQIFGHSIHYPSRCMRIVIEPKVKLPYTKRVRVVSPERLTWEKGWDAARLKVDLGLACDFIDHVLPLVDDEERNDFTETVSTLRLIASRVSVEFYDETKKELDELQAVLNRKVRDRGREGRGPASENRNCTSVGLGRHCLYKGWSQYQRCDVSLR